MGVTPPITVAGRPVDTVSPIFERGSVFTGTPAGGATGFGFTYRADPPAGPGSSCCSTSTSNPVTASTLSIGAAGLMGAGNSVGCARGAGIGRATRGTVGLPNLGFPSVSISNPIPTIGSVVGGICRANPAPMNASAFSWVTFTTLPGCPTSISICTTILGTLLR